MPIATLQLTLSIATADLAKQQSFLAKITKFANQSPDVEVIASVIKVGTPKSVEQKMGPVFSLRP